MKTLKWALAAGAAVMLSGCIREARIVMPSELTASTEALQISGMGLGRRGDFKLAGMDGRFTRGADSLSFSGDLLVSNSGGGSFRYAGLEGTCRYREQEVNVGVFSTRTKPFAYHCYLDRNGVPAGELLIREERGTTGAMLSKRGREGYLIFDNVRYDIKSVHRLEGGRLATATALGYRFDVAGRSVGAVDLNGPNKTLFAPRVGASREAIFAGALALSVLWDPATL